MYRRKMHINGPKSVPVRNEEEEVIGMKIHHLDSVSPTMPNGTPQLFVAIQHGPDNSKRLLELIKEGHQVNQLNRDHTTPLHIAAEKGYVRCICVLLEYGAEVDILDDYGYSPLIRACRGGKCKALKLLMDAGANLELCNETGQTVLHYSILAKPTGCLDTILRHPLAKRVINAKDHDGNTPLMSALMLLPNDRGMAMTLIEAGANISIANGYGLQAIHYAASYSSPELINKLLDAGSNINAKDAFGITPFVMSIKCDNAPAIQTLIDRGCNTLSIDGLNATALTMATMMNHLDCVRILLNYAEDPDELGFIGQSALMGACYQSNIAMVDLLLNANADPNIVSRQGTTALINALIKVTPENASHRHEIVKRIIKAGADVNYRVKGAAYYTEVTNGRNCPLSFSIASGYISLVTILMNAGADVASSEIDQWKEFPATNDTFEHIIDGVAFLPHLKSFYRNPRTLKHICRAHIRSYLGQNVHIEHTINSLEVPKLIREYLSFSDIEIKDYNMETCKEQVCDPGIYLPLMPTVMTCGLLAIERQFGFHKFSSQTTSL